MRIAFFRCLEIEVMLVCEVQENVGAVEKVRVKEAGVECFQGLGRKCVFCCL